MCRSTIHSKLRIRFCPVDILISEIGKIKKNKKLEKNRQTLETYGAKPQKSGAQPHQGRALFRPVHLREGRAVLRFTRDAKVPARAKYR